MKDVSIKQLEDPESTSAGKDGISYNIKEMEGIRDLGSERADVLRQISFGAQVASMQPPVHVESGRSQTIFLPPRWRSPVWLLELWS